MQLYKKSRTMADAAGYREGCYSIRKPGHETRRRNLRRKGFVTLIFPVFVLFQMNSDKGAAFIESQAVKYANGLSVICRSMHFVHFRNRPFLLSNEIEYFIPKYTISTNMSAGDKSDG